MAQATILLSHERSGSHFVGEFIGKLANVSMYDEVGNPFALVPTKSRASFYAFRNEYLKNAPDFLLNPSLERQVAFVGAYFDFLTELQAPKNIVVDIKYGHVHMFENFWAPPFERPFMFNIAEQRGIRILHLYRINVVEAAASQMIAGIRKVWHSWQLKDEAGFPQSIRLDPAVLVKTAKLLEIQNRWFDSTFIGGCKRKSLTYERVSKELGVSEALGEEIAKFVGGSVRATFTPRHQKVTPPLSEIVSNFDEIRAACETASLGKYLDGGSSGL